MGIRGVGRGRYAGRVGQVQLFSVPHPIPWRPGPRSVDAARDRQARAGPVGRHGRSGLHASAGGGRERYRGHDRARGKTVRGDKRLAIGDRHSGAGRRRRGFLRRGACRLGRSGGRRVDGRARARPAARRRTAANRAGPRADPRAGCCDGRRPGDFPGRRGCSRRQPCAGALSHADACLAAGLARGCQAAGPIGADRRPSCGRDLPDRADCLCRGGAGRSQSARLVMGQPRRTDPGERHDTGPHCWPRPFDLGEPGDRPRLAASHTRCTNRCCHRLERREARSTGRSGGANGRDASSRSGPSTAPRCHAADVRPWTSGFDVTRRPRRSHDPSDPPRQSPKSERVPDPCPRRCPGGRSAGGWSRSTGSWRTISASG